MKWVRRFLLIAVLAVAAWFGYGYFFPDEEARIRKHLDGLTEAATVTADFNTLGKLASATRLAGHFASEVVIRLEGVGEGAESIHGRDEVQQIAVAAMAQIQSLEPGFHDVSITIAPDQESANVHLTALARVDGEPDLFAQELKMKLRKFDGDWLITEVETVRTLGNGPIR